MGIRMVAYVPGEPDTCIFYPEDRGNIFVEKCVAINENAILHVWRQLAVSCRVAIKLKE